LTAGITYFCQYAWKFAPDWLSARTSSVGSAADAGVVPAYQFERFRPQHDGHSSGGIARRAPAADRLPKHPHHRPFGVGVHQLDRHHVG